MGVTCELFQSGSCGLRLYTFQTIDKEISMSESTMTFEQIDALMKNVDVAADCHQHLH